MIRTLAILFIVVVLIGSLGAAGFMYYERQVTEDNWSKLNHAEALLMNEDTQEATLILLDVVQQGDRFEGASRALYRLAQAYEAAGVPEAHELWTRLVERYPESEYYTEARLKQANHLFTSNPEQALEIYGEIESSSDPVIRGQALLAIAESMDSNGNPQSARDYYYRILEGVAPDDIIARAKDRLSEMNTQMLWSPALCEFTQLYTVERGDVPLHIGNEFRVPSYFILEANNIQGHLRPGRQIKVPKEPFRVVVNKADCTLDLLTESGKFVKWYSVGVGELSYKTPAGEYTIEEKSIDPVWYSPHGRVYPANDPENALGTRWMGIGGSLGIHGTNEPESIGSASSAGCIRMQNHEVEELFKLITINSRVTIVEDMETGTPS